MSTDFGPLYLTHFEEKLFAKLVLGSKSNTTGKNKTPIVET